MKPQKFSVFFFCLFMICNTLSATSLSETLKKYGLMHLNEWIMYYPFDWLGVITYPGTSPEGGAFFPVQGGLMVMVDGLVWAGFVQDGRHPALQAGGSYFRSGVQPGWIIEQGSTGRAPRPVELENEKVRMYRWRKDFFKVNEDELRKEVALLLTIPEDSVTEAQIDTLRQQYWQDLQDWPADLGAPYYDRNQNGHYDPDYDEPGYLGSDQLIWYVVNDLNAAKTKSLFGCLPMGLEVQVTVWSYKVGLSSVIFRRYKFVNKSGYSIDSMFVGQFAESDLGDFRDDLVGCDSTLGYGFSYNGSEFDEVFANFGMSAPALGIVLLQGPIVPQSGALAIQDLQNILNYKNLPMTGFWYHATGGGTPYADMGIYEGALDIYAQLQGNIEFFDFTGEIIPFVRGDIEGLISSPWPLAGDPLTGQGDIDGKDYNMSPGNRAFMVNTGPFSLQPGQSQEIIYAYVAAYSTGNQLDALANLQKMIPTVKKAYQEFLNFEPPVGPRKSTKPEISDSSGVDYFLLAEGYPNPFSQNVKIKFRLLNQMDIRLEVFNSAGQRVKTIYQGPLSKGIHDLQWDGTNQSGSRLPSGVYFIRLKHGPLMRWKKIIMLK